jgi:hypothetical protein
MPLIPFYDPLSFADIASIFSQPVTSVTIGRYYRGGTIVSDNLANQQVPRTGAISVSDFYGDARGRVFVDLVISSNTFNFDLYANRKNAYVPGLTDISVVVNNGVYVGSNVATAPAMSVPNSFSAGDTVSITNYGYIYGRGGDGGGGFGLPGTPGAMGDTGLYVNSPATVFNYGEISGGGGGGGGGALYVPNKGPHYPGGGGGGGAGYSGGSGGGGTNAGAAGSLNAGGAGGSGAVENYGSPGGARAAAGIPGGPISGANPAPGGNGGAGGYSVIGSGYINWVATGTRTGPVG